MHRFYCPAADLSKKTITIVDKNELHHLRDVLRLKAKDEVALFDGSGKEADGYIVSVTAASAEIALHSLRLTKRRKPTIILACALPKKSKFELIIEKATELSVDEIIPLKTARTEIHLKGERLDKKHLRYRSVAINACKQSGRSFVPTIHPVGDFRSVVDHLTLTTQSLIPSLSGKRKDIFSVLSALKSANAVSFLIGPEGDFTPEEYSYARKKGCAAVTLGETILKVETAALCALSCASLYLRT